MISIAHAAPNVSEKMTVNLNAWDAILTASPIVQATLFLLVLMSVSSWAIILSKRRYYTKVQAEDKKFIDAFWKSDSLEDIHKSLSHYRYSAAARVFLAGYSELQKVASRAMKENKETDVEDEETPSLHGADNIERSLQRTIEDEIVQLESRLNVLATTGSTGPFIGLFGTVWGIMGSFQKIGAMKSASLAVVAPGISEALVATAIGLAAAIPAVIGYNHFVTRLRRIETRLNHFSSDYLNVVKRTFFKES